MLHPHIITTNTQKVLSLLTKFSDQEFYEREVARRLAISAGSANRALNELFSSGVLTRRREGKMFFYSIDSSNNVTITELKKIINLLLIEPLVEALKAISSRIVLYELPILSRPRHLGQYQRLQLVNREVLDVVRRHIPN